MMVSVDDSVVNELFQRRAAARLEWFSARCNARIYANELRSMLRSKRIEAYHSPLVGAKPYLTVSRSMLGDYHTSSAFSWMLANFERSVDLLKTLRSHRPTVIGKLIP